ncbi:MAG: sugar-binding domain-containing protein [Eubacteriales bacterium]
MSIPRPEHPRPQMFRSSWQSLNGEWDFEFDFSNSGQERRIYENPAFSKKITVPFCPESELSGINHKDFIPAVWYKKSVSLTASQLDGTVLLHFGAVDYYSEIYVNARLAGRHSGGYSSFTVDITPYAVEGDNTIVVRAVDDVRSGHQPAGKQSGQHFSYGCMYTRTTGIWQSVWLEFVAKSYMKGIKLETNYKTGEVMFGAKVAGCRKDLSLRYTVSLDGKSVLTGGGELTGEISHFTFKVENPSLWDIGSPTLYDITYQLVRDRQTVDSVDSYFGIRGVEIIPGAICLNGKPVFQRLILDQGFYPDGIYTAPSDEALKQDIQFSMDLGFNGARLHQKVFEERFLYWADKMGYIVWGEQASWGININTSDAIARFLPEWLEVMERDYNHPALVGWCPFNETHDRQDNEVLRMVYLASKAFDPTRPVIDTSGYVHVETDVYDIHDYDQNPESFSARYSPENMESGKIFMNHGGYRIKSGQPYFVSEYGGIKWTNDTSAVGWGYGNEVKSFDEWIERYEGLTLGLLNSRTVCAFCYTQLTDVELELNGMYTYPRERKFPDYVYDRIRIANQTKAAIEK